MAAPPPDEWRDGAPSPWRLPVAYGSAAALQAIGTVAAPLLAGFSFTLAALVLSSPSRFRWPDITLLLLMSAGVALITAVQAAAWARRWDVSPSELLAWWPEFDALPESQRETIYREQQEHAQRHARWARATQVAYDSGILLLLAGVTLLVMPITAWHLLSVRTFAVIIGVSAFLSEVVWVSFSVLMARRKY
jgi:hypothetical protein